MSDPRSPLQHAWHFALLLLGITIALTITIWLLSKIWLVVLCIVVAAVLCYVAYLVLQRRRGRW